MRSEWNKVRLEEVIEFNPRESLPKGTLAKKISMEQVQPFTKTVSGYEKKMYLGGSKFRNNDTIMARITPCLENGKTALVNILDDGEIGFGSTEFIVMRNIESLTDKDFVYYLAISPELRQIAIKSMVGSSGRQRVQQSVLEEYNIHLPPLEEQRAIAATLSSIDNKIGLNNKINVNLEEQVQAIYNNWFVDFEPFQDGEFANSELGDLPVGWSVKTIAEIAEKVAMGPFGSNIKVETFVEKGVPIISGNHLRGLYLDEIGYNYITQEHATKLKNSLVYAGDIIFTHAGNIGQVALIPENCDYPYYVISQRQFYLRCNKDKALPEYINYYFHGREGQGRLLANASQTGVPSIARPSSHLKSIVVPLPPITVQLAWFEIVQPLLQAIIQNYKENKRLVAIRDTLLPKLMSGEIIIL